MLLMRKQRKGGWAAIKEIFTNWGRRIAISRRRFSRRGGISGFMSRTVAGLAKGELRAIATVCVAVLVLGGCVWGGIALSGGRASAKVGASQASTAALRASGTALAADNDVVSLEEDMARLQAGTTPAPTATPAPTPTPLLYSKGYEGPEVAKIQARLMELGYMDNDVPTEKFGSITKEAVELFQRSHGLTIDGCVGQQTYDLLMSAQAKKYMVSIGVSGTDVEQLQSRLVELDYMKKTTGYFGEETEAAIRDFQERNHLTVDGKVGEETREMLYSEDAIPKSLSYGEKSDDVLKYQERLYKLGYLTTEPDGTFGKDTVAATKLFQQINGLIVDGHIGPSTRKLLMSSDAEANALTLGMSGDTVQKVQSKLRELGYLGAKATGYYGSDTEEAVKAFQKRNGLSVDGKAGRYTIQALFSGSAKAAASDYVPVEGSSSSSDSGSSSSSSSSGSTSSGGSLNAFISAAKSKLGCRYVRGGKGPNTFDCSGFVYWCLRQAGVSQKYLTSSGWRNVSNYQKVRSLTDLKMGDVIVFYGHVAIAMGDGTMIDASSSEGKVVHRSCLGDWSYDNFICAWRIF